MKEIRLLVFVFDVGNNFGVICFAVVPYYLNEFRNPDSNFVLLLGARCTRY